MTPSIRSTWQSGSRSQSLSSSAWLIASLAGTGAQRGVDCSSWGGRGSGDGVYGTGNEFDGGIGVCNSGWTAGEDGKSGWVS